MNVWERARGSSAEPPKTGSRSQGQRTAGRKADRAPSMPPVNTWVWFLLLLLLNFVVFRTFFAEGDAVLTIPYTVFKEQVAAGNVVEIYNQGQRIEGRFIEPATFPPAVMADGAPEAGGDAAAESGARRAEPRTGTTFDTTVPAFVDPGLEALLIDNGVEITAEPIETGSSPLGVLLFGFGPAILIIAFYVWLFRRAARQGGGGLGGLMGIGRSRARANGSTSAHMRALIRTIRRTAEWYRGQGLL